MADQDLSHTADIIKAALPYVDDKTKGLAELFVKLFDLFGSIKSKSITGNLTALGFQGMKIDVEGLLKGVRPICTLKEREFVDRILNIFNMKRMFEMYTNMMSTMNTMQEFGGFNFGGDATQNEAENGTGNFSGFNFESIFQSFKDTFSSDGSEASSDSTDSAESTDISDSSSFTNPFYQSDRESVETSEDDTRTNEEESNASASDSNPNPMNNKMFDMLKAMIPPEQQSTFENLSMLFNSMSYDNNSNPDDSEEQKYG